VATLLASVCYDLGDLKSLERALHELTEASRALLASGDALGAARLLNDQAAVYVRLGDPVRASHLLEESRRVFERQAGADPIAAAELAETYHLLARLPLHVAARPGREADALAMGRDYAQAAEAAYRRLGAARELTRVWETMGRIEMRAERLEPAMRSLTAALEAQRELGDVLGLARTTAALAELLARSEQAENALQLLAESIHLNVEKGSPIGLAYNRRSLEALARSVPPQLTGLHREVYRKLSAAEASLGRIKLPGERD
jgi:tetratricopeptide (TPR) repeat protein